MSRDPHPDLAPKIAEFLAGRLIDAPTRELAKGRPGGGEALWMEMHAAFPEASMEELARGTFIALELIAARSAEIAAEMEELRKRRKP